MQNKHRGFTLIEILIVIGLIAVLAGIVLIAINPARQFAQGRDTQRISNLNTILNAINQRMADNKGVFAGKVGTLDCGPIPTTTATISSDVAANATTPTGALGCLVPTYIPALPSDPVAASGASTGYEIVQSTTTGRITVSAPEKEPSIPRTTTLEITR